MAVATKEDTLYAQRLEMLRAAAGSLTTTKASTAALFNERNAERMRVRSYYVVHTLKKTGKKVVVHVRSGI